MAAPAEFIRFIVEQMEGFGPVTAKRMFGGAGVYRDGLMIALIAGEVLYLKADGESRAAFEAEGLGPFVYAAKNGRNTIMSYWRAPERCLEDPDEMRDWARMAHGAALRAAKVKR